MEPKVSVLLPVHNAEVYLPEAVESILGQSLTDFELICIDDGSSDRSHELLQRYAARDRRVRVFRTKHAGLIAALNEGLKIARAPLVARMDADDVSTPERLEQQHRRFQLDPELWVLGTAEERIDACGCPRGRPPVVTGSDAVARALRERCVIRHPSVMMRREPILGLGGYRPAYKHAEDYDLWLRVSEHAKLDNLEFVGLRYRMHPESVSERHTARQRISAELARATHRLRMSGQQDPTDGLRAEPDLWNDPLLDQLIPAHVRFFRFLDLAYRTASEEFDHELAWHLLRHQDKDVVKANRHLWQEALTYLVQESRRWDSLRGASFVAAFQTHPGRFIRSFIGFRRKSTTHIMLRKT